MANWWESAPLVEAPKAGRNWWEAAPVVQEAPQSTQQVTAGQAVAPPGINPFNAGVASGLTANFADELFAAGMTPIEAIRGVVTGEDEGKGFGERLSDSYGRALDKNRALEAEARAANSVAATAGDVVGGLITSGQLARGGATLLNTARPTLPSMVGRGAAEGAAYGAAYGAGAGEGTEGRLGNAAMGAGIGALFGAGAGAIGARQATRDARKSIPTADDLKASAQQAYQAAENAGLVVGQPGISRMVDTVAARIAKEGMHPRLHPRVATALDELQKAKGTPQTLEQLDLLRRVVRNAGSSSDPSERRLAAIMTDEVDNFLDRLTPNDVVAGRSREGVQALKQARELWSRTRKAEVVEDMFTKAQERASQFSGSGYENALRTEARGLLRNGKVMRSFTKEEREAVRRIAKGAPLDNVLRFVGKMAPTGVVSTALSVGLGQAAGGLAGGVALPAVGFAARQAATAATVKNATRLDDLVRSGGAFPSVQQLTGPQRAYLESILVTGAGQGPDLVPTGTSR